jgi:hypothetical protein
VLNQTLTKETFEWHPQGNKKNINSSDIFI